MPFYIFLGGRLSQPLPSRFYFASIISEMELLSYPALNASTELQIRNFLSEITVVGPTDSVKTTAISIRRQEGLKLPDAIVVGTAMVLDAELLTNDAHLSKWAMRLPVR